MPFEKGRAKTGGRKAGQLNNDKKVVLAKMKELGLDVPGALARVGQEAEANGDLTVARAAYSDLMSYCYPRLKAVEHTVDTSDGSVFEINMVGIDRVAK